MALQSFHLWSQMTNFLFQIHDVILTFCSGVLYFFQGTTAKFRFCIFYQWHLCWDITTNVVVMKWTKAEMKKKMRSLKEILSNVCGPLRSHELNSYCVVYICVNIFNFVFDILIILLAFIVKFWAYIKFLSKYNLVTLVEKVLKLRR